MPSDELKSELRENYQRIEEVLTGMDAYITHLHNTIRSHEDRIATLEGQLASLVAAMSGAAEPAPDLGLKLR
ncbi:hypothetical protein Thiowin_04073 [Thiorhodovibrio winogradskyi]|uniref:SlyX protein n=1 Tax=Thiorhodovibrio winogradskyi TaxID=77007 RepID=A0ABZ0SFX5_9GAMM|nr:hypothetical protein [Thiorhodovibrio winogradskyi]